jgi:hypothetical protein
MVMEVNAMDRFVTMACYMTVTLLGVFHRLGSYSEPDEQNEMERRKRRRGRKRLKEGKEEIE